MGSIPEIPSSVAAVDFGARVAGGADVSAVARVGEFLVIGSDES